MARGWGAGDLSDSGLRFVPRIHGIAGIGWLLVAMAVVIQRGVFVMGVVLLPSGGNGLVPVLPLH